MLSNLRGHDAQLGPEDSSPGDGLRIWGCRLEWLLVSAFSMLLCLFSMDFKRSQSQGDLQVASHPASFSRNDTSSSLQLCTRETWMAPDHEFYWVQSSLIKNASVATSLEVHSKRCQIQRFKGDEFRLALSCLKDRHIVFIGDSLLRYTYLNLVNFVVQRNWHAMDPPNEEEKKWMSWLEFYEVSIISTQCGRLSSLMAGARVQISVLGGKEICDCFRVPDTQETNLENRYFYDKESSIRLSFLQYLVPQWGLRGHDLEWLGDQNRGRTGSRSFNQSGCRPGYCDEVSHPTQWKFDLIDGLARFVKALEPDIVIFNSGFWQRMPGGVNTTRLIQAGLEAVKVKRGRMIFRTTTATRMNDEMDDDNFLKELQSGGWTVLDTHHQTKELAYFEDKFPGSIYWDNLHFHPSVYAGLNQILLNGICSPFSSPGGRCTLVEACAGGSGIDNLCLLSYLTSTRVRISMRRWHILIRQQQQAPSPPAPVESTGTPPLAPAALAGGSRLGFISTMLGGAAARVGGATSSRLCNPQRGEQPPSAPMRSDAGVQQQMKYGRAST